MEKTPEFISLDGEPVTFEVQSGCLLFTDAVNIEEIRDCNCIGDLKLARSNPVQYRKKMAELESKVFPFGFRDNLGYYEIENFQPGTYTLKIEDIRTYAGESNERAIPPEILEKAETIFNVETGQIFIVDIKFLEELVQRHKYEGMFLPEEKISAAGFLNLNYFKNLAKNIGCPCFAFVTSPTSDGFEFEGDGVYQVPAGSVQKAPEK